MYNDSFLSRTKWQLKCNHCESNAYTTQPHDVSLIVSHVLGRCRLVRYLQDNAFNTRAIKTKLKNRGDGAVGYIFFTASQLTWEHSEEIIGPLYTQCVMYSYSEMSRSYYNFSWHLPPPFYILRELFSGQYVHVHDCIGATWPGVPSGGVLIMICLIIMWL